MGDELKDMSSDVSTSQSEKAFVQEITRKAQRKLKYQHDESKGVWFGLGMAGIIGWSVAVPTIGGALLGLWWDQHHPGTRSWTLALLAAGLVVGCANAWHWVSEQDNAMHDDSESRDE